MYYTKYRPQKFSEISKPNDTAVALMNQVKGEKTVHAYLFVGPRGTGKTTTARILAKALNCTSKTKEKTGDPCGKCSSCKAITQGNYIDLIEIDAASNRGIDDIRQLRDKIKLAPSAGDTKVYIIDEVHMLTTEAFNALLKTLEEPPAHGVFILCTTELHKVPDTIKSRCQLYKFKRATREQIVKKLQDICKAEGVSKLKKSDLEKIADASFGGFRDAETVLQQVVEGDLDPESFVGLSSKDIFVSFVDALINKDLLSALKTLTNMVEDGQDLSVWVYDLLSYLRDLLFVQAGVHSELTDLTDESLEPIQEQAAHLTNKEVVAIIDVFLEAESKMKKASMVQLPLELAVVKLTSASELTDKVKATPGPSPKSSPNTKKSTEKSVPVDYQEKEQAQDQEQDLDQDESLDYVETAPVASVELSTVASKWQQILKESVQHNNSIHALLKACSPVAVIGSEVVLEVSYSFHKERLESQRNRKIIESLLTDVVGLPLGLQCKINKDKRPKKKVEKEVGELTDHNVVVPAFSSDDMNAIFDGALPE